MTADLARAGGPLACIGLAVLIAAPRRDLRIAGLGAWVVGCAFLASYLAPSGHTKVYAAAAAVGAIGAVAIAELFRRWPWLIAVGTLACAPARIPVHVGSTDSNLLLPLYAVVVGAALLLGFELVRGDTRSRELGPLTWPAAALVAWTGLTLLWTEDLHEGAVALLFFWLPFGMIALSLARLAWSRRWLTFLFAQLGLMAAAFAVIGMYQYATRDVFWNPKVIVGNAYAPFYRVNSVFYDPSVYGRFLVIGILAALVIALYDRNRRNALGGGGGDRGDLGGPAVLVLAVELRGADRRHGRRRRVPVALARDPRARHRVGVDRRRRTGHAAHPPLASARIRGRPEQGVERPREARHRGDQDRAAPSGAGGRDRWLQARLREPRTICAARSRRRRHRTTRL